MKTRAWAFFLAIVVCVALGAKEWAPDYMIIGAQKSGTTALFSFINQHPKTLRQTGEIHYFDNQYQHDLAWYRKQFPEKPDDSYIIGDKSPYYLFHPLVAKRVYKHFPNVKIIIVLRNPVDRSYSQYQMNRRNKSEKESSFEEALYLEKKRTAGEEEKMIDDPTYHSWNHKHYSYVARSHYVDQVKHWLKYFPRDQILFVDSNRLRHHLQETMDEVFEFLGVEPFTVHVADPDKHHDYPPMKPETRQMLSDHFKPYNEELEKLLHIKFNWK